MDLREFVSQTLIQIIEGVNDTQAKAKELTAEINPRLSASNAEMGKHGFIGTGGMQAAQMVQFDVALTVVKGKGTKGGIGVFAGAINVGSAGQSQSESSSVSRVKFAVPLALPGGK